MSGWYWQDVKTWTPRPIACLLLLQMAACGGMVVEEEGASAGGGQVSTPHSGYGSQTQTLTPPPNGGSTGSSSAAAAICFGVPKPAPTERVVTFDLGPIGSDAKECVINVPIADNKKLNPAKAFFYFDGQNGARMEIPYVGTAADCVNSTAYGGWYATNTTGGPTNIGLCGCVCTAARKYAFHLDVAVTGML
ncbi:MAG TPA: hypothetical protein VKP30_19700 [Polyangiaceae bacterium]|nr:hypothetical protein [Polyangiaceae bacterium]